MKLECFAYESPVGAVYCLLMDDCLVDVSMGEKEAAGKKRRGRCGEKEGTVISTEQTLSPAMRSLKRALDNYFSGKRETFDVELKFLTGTPFEQKVWLALREIPYGETRTYKWIAERAGNAKAVRAAGQALRKNPLPLVIPCHRVIGSDGSLTGFSCGIGIKKKLLELEKAIP